ncbi:HPF/RaiA family ribosome-associated protein [Candidatus Kaiserbacteria bacterium]|nr:HPF/RaiA family ribosome-associated protein [Candidatus Kaiserbacteria bacterium]
MNTFPSFNLKTTNFEQTPIIEDVLGKRLGTLEKFLPDGETMLVCEVELEKLAGQQTGKIFRAEINLQVGGTLLRAEATAERMEDAIEQMKNELKSELVKAGGKKHSVFKRGAKKLKEMLLFGGE